MRASGDQLLQAAGAITVSGSPLADDLAELMPKVRWSDTDTLPAANPRGKEDPDTASNTKPAYTVIGVYESGPTYVYQRFVEVFYTFNGPASAERLAEEWARAQDGEPEIIIAAVLKGEVEINDEPPEQGS
jgi:hypothetical protein